jgi:CheY-like chemotaxis protein
LDLVTDGHIRWYDPISYLAGKLEGVKINGLLRFFDTNFYFRQPVVQGSIKRTQSLLLEDYRYASSVSEKPVKVVFTGPFTLAKYSVIEQSASRTFERVLEDYTSAIADEVRSLVKEGATMIQVDEPAILEMLRNHFSMRGYEVATAGDGSEGLEVLESEQPDVVRLDLKMKKLDGDRFLKEARERNVSAKILVVSGYQDEALRNKVEGLGIDAFLEKPVSIIELTRKIQELTAASP